MFKTVDKSVDYVYKGQNIWLKIVVTCPLVFHVKCQDVILYKLVLWLLMDMMCEQWAIQQNRVLDRFNRIVLGTEEIVYNYFNFS